MVMDPFSTGHGDSRSVLNIGVDPFAKPTLDGNELQPEQGNQIEIGGGG